MCETEVAFGEQDDGMCRVTFWQENLCGLK